MAVINDDDQGHVLVGTSSVDSIFGNGGNDTVYGGNSDDLLKGGQGNDLIVGGAQGDEIYGGDGIDTASYVGSNAGVSVSLLLGTASGGHATGDELTKIENLAGSSYGDALSGDNFANRLDGGSGNDGLYGNGGDDKLYGGAGNDYMMGGNGNDYFEGGNGADSFIGGNGVDTVSYSSAFASVAVDMDVDLAVGGGSNGDSFDSVENLWGTAYSDQLYATSAANLLYGGGGNDNLYARDGNDSVNGGAGNDYMDGGNGNDQLEGSSGNDVISGGNGVDKVIGGDGVDQVYGGAGRDELWGGLTSNVASNDQGDRFAFLSKNDSDWELTFVNGNFSLVDTRDRIMDLGTGDRIDVSVIDANSVAAGNQDFNWQGDDALTGIGQARAFFQGGDTIVQLSTDADAAAEMEIVVKGLHLIDHSDFVGVFA